MAVSSPPQDRGATGLSSGHQADCSSFTKQTRCHETNETNETNGTINANVRLLRELLLGILLGLLGILGTSPDVLGFEYK